MNQSLKDIYCLRDVLFYESKVYWDNMFLHIIPEFLHR